MKIIVYVETVTKIFEFKNLDGGFHHRFLILKNSPDDNPYTEYQHKNRHIPSAWESQRPHYQDNPIIASYRASIADMSDMHNSPTPATVQSRCDEEDGHNLEYDKEFDSYEYPLSTQHNLIC